MEIEDEIRKSRELFKAKRVYGEPVERDGITIVPAAEIMGGGGAGGGENSDGETGGGSGFGIHARPVGAWIVADDRAEWKSSVDVNRAIIAAQALIVLLLAMLWLRRRRD